MLVVGLVRRGEPGPESLGVVAAVATPVPGHVVDHVVVVGDAEEGRRCVRGLEVGIEPVLRVPHPVVLQGVQVPERPVSPVVARRRVLGATTFVDVVAHVHHHVVVLLGDVAQRGVPSGDQALARQRREPQRGHGRPGRGEGASAADRAEMVTGPETVEVDPVREQAGHLDPSTVGQSSAGHRVTVADQVSERLVGGDLPVDPHGGGRHPAVPAQRIGRQPGPQQHAVGRGVTGGDAEGERVRGQGRSIRLRVLGSRVSRDPTSRVGGWIGSR